LGTADLGGAASRGLRSVASPTGLRGCGRELTWLAAHAALYPLGLLAERTGKAAGTDTHRLDALSPLRRGLVSADLEAAGAPILLVHGMADNRSVFLLLRRALRRRGFGRVHTVNYSPFTTDVRAAARSLGRAVESLCEQTGYERVHVVAHSLGGVVARYAVQRLGGDARVHTLVTLGAPHGGTCSARLLPLRLCRQLRPGSELIQELAAPAPGCRTRFVAVWSDLDQLIYPKRNARIDHPDLDFRNVLLRGVGHTSLPVDARVAREVIRTLAHLDQDGSTAAAAAPFCPPEPPADVVVLADHPAETRRTAPATRRAHERVRKGTSTPPFG
jgi:pimeloyl-ACP methyl ester carboxylesterase